MYLYKLIFLTTLFMGTMISVSSTTWMGTWMGLEINLLSFIPLMKEKNNSFSSESSMKYFLIQALASAIFFFSIIFIMMNQMNNESMEMNNLIKILINSTLFLKMGAAPFHFWFPEIIDGLSWLNSLIIMTWQKIAPMMIISYSIVMNKFIIMIIISCSVIGSIGGLNQTSLRKILAFSSINHIGWMISSFMKNETIWIIYFMIYSLISLTIILLFMTFNIFYLKQMFILMNKKILIKFMILMNLLSLGGLPPFLGFFPKWMIIQYLSDHSLVILIMIMTTLITLFFYLRIAYTSIIISHNQMNYLIMENKISYTNLVLSLISLAGLTVCTLIFNFN